MGEDYLRPLSIFCLWHRLRYPFRPQCGRFTYISSRSKLAPPDKKDHLQWRRFLDTLSKAGSLIVRWESVCIADDLWRRWSGSFEIPKTLTSRGSFTIREDDGGQAA